MMTDHLTWSPIYLGRWAGTQVRIHFLLIVLVVVKLLNAAIEKDQSVLRTASCLLLLLVALALHELGHALMAAWLGQEPEEVRLWPLGNMVGPSVTSRSTDNFVVALTGPIVSGVMVVASAVGLYVLDAQFVWDPFNKNGSGAPTLNLTHLPAPAYSPVWWIGWFGYLNYVIMLANLIPALPFDGGRMLRAYLAQSSVVLAKENLFPPLFARSCAGILFVGGLLRLLFYNNGDGLFLCVLAFVIELMVRSEARMIEDGGFFDDGVFGYDFSEGYTSLEGSAANKVRPYRESAIKRWRRRRSELRRQRRQVREAAEERRMDEILEKLHRQGRTALSDEEHRFLVRVSAKYRNRPRAHD